MTFVVIPHYNGPKKLDSCLQALKQSTRGVATIVVVDNHSTDGSRLMLKGHKEVIVLEQERNLGFAGGVNAGIRYALENEAEYVLLLNNDAVADEDWAKRLIKFMNNNPEAGIATSKMIQATDPPRLDSTGEFYSTWGLPFPRGRGETDIDAYDESTEIFGASGGATIYRTKMFNDIGLFDEDFFAYYEDVDISFRAQRAGWRVRYVPDAIVYHKVGGTSSKMKGFTTYHTFKNLPWLIIKNLPARLWLTVVPRFIVAYILLFGSALSKGKGWYALKGMAVSLFYAPKKFIQHLQFRANYQRMGRSYLYDSMYQGLPPTYKKLYAIFHPIKSRQIETS